MKTGRILAIVIALAAAGCSSTDDPYFIKDHWYVRQNATPQYFATYDVFYMFPEMYDGGPVSATNYDYIVKQTVDQFGKKVRVFAPLCHDEDEVEDALDWYLDNYHDRGRPFVFMGEGEGGKYLRDLVDCSERKGLVSYHFTTNALQSFITPEVVEMVNEEVREFLYLREWHLD